MQRTAKPVRQLMLAAMIALASSYLGARVAVSHAPAAKPSMFVLVDDEPKPCPSC